MNCFCIPYLACRVPPKPNDPLQLQNGVWLQTLVGWRGERGRENEQCFELEMQPSDLKLCLLWSRALQNDASLWHGIPHLELEMNYDHDVNTGITSVSVCLLIT